MSVLLNKHTSSTQQLLASIHPDNAYEWYFTFVSRNPSFGYKIHFLSSLNTRKQIIKNSINSLTKKKIHFVSLVFDKKNWHTLLDKSSKNELFLECLFGNTDTMIPICRLPIITHSINKYFVSKSDISSKFKNTFNRIHFKTHINNKGLYVIRFAIERK